MIPVAAPKNAPPSSLAAGIARAAAVQGSAALGTVAAAVPNAAAHPAQAGLLALLNHARGLAALPATVSGTGSFQRPITGLPSHVSGGITLSPATAPAQDPYTAAVAEAQKLAQAQVDAQVSALRDQQTLAGQQAAQRAAAINSASLGAAQFLSGLGDQTQADYAAALNSNTGLSEGYSGQLRTDAADEAAKVQSMLGSVQGNTQTANDKGGSLANLLYGLTGAIPGQALTVQGLGATAAARALPAASIGYGQQEALGALSAGQSAQDQITQQIAQAQGTLPQVEQGYASQLTSAAQNSQNLQLQRQSQANQVTQFNTTTRQNQISSAAQLAFQKAQAKATADQNAVELKIKQAEDTHAAAVDAGNTTRANRALTDQENATKAAAVISAKNALAQAGYNAFNEKLNMIKAGYDPSTGAPLTPGQLPAVVQAKLYAPIKVGSAASGYGLYFPKTATVTQVTGPPPATLKVETFANGGVMEINPTTGASRIIHQPTIPIVKPTIEKAGDGSLWQFYADGRPPMKIPDTGKPSKPASGSLTANETLKTVQGWWKGTTVPLRDAASGQPQLNSDGSPKTTSTGQVPYQSAIARLVASGKPPVVARRIVNSVYAEGDFGRPYSKISNAISNIEQNVSASIAHGNTAGDVYKSFLATGVYPPTIRKALVYKINQLYTQDYFKANPDAKFLPTGVLVKST